MKALKFYRENKLFLHFLFLFCWVFILKNSIGIADSWRDFVFHLDAPIWVFIQAILIFLLTSFIKRKFYNDKINQVSSMWRYLKFFVVSFIIYILINNILGLFISYMFNTIPRNYGNSFMITYKLFNQVIDFIIFGGISLAYLYSKENRDYRKRLSEYEIASSKSKIQQLKNQLNPHFLFNNLNVLDQLIEEDKEKASEFLSSFSELYRYALFSSENELIHIDKELVFTQNYFELMDKKYEKCYRLNISEEIRNSEIMVPPFCLQVLIENAIMHNLGTIEHPVIIQINLEKGIKISNNKAKLKYNKKTNGVALKNLNKQFQLLTNRSIDFIDTENNFTVILPLIKMNTHD